ncbi:MAG: DNA-3-methyladenine glycosylase 2 family protein [Myxococcota bacterium]|nr:DNA-3-methyladenine glycosylase 2 family protein [Myxococcota bacterium]
MAPSYAETVLPVEGPYDLRNSVRDLLLGSDPGRAWRDGVFWFAGRWGGEVATVRATRVEDGVHAAAWGPGRDAALAAAHALVGLHDDPRTFRPAHAFVRELHARRIGMRIPRTGQVMTALVKGVLGQLVTTRDAALAWRAVVRTYGAPAPGPAGLWLGPEPVRLARLHPSALTPLGMLRKQAEAIIRVCRVAPRLEEVRGMALGPAMKRLMTVRGIGPWTAGNVVGPALGNPDAVILGDLHLARMVGLCLAGEPDADDRRMMTLLEPFRGHRYRVVRLLHTSGVKPPRNGPLADRPLSWGGPG